MVFLEAPGGGTTGVWQAGTHQGAARYNEPGAFAWSELLTPEPQAAIAFFQQLFGHDVTEYPQDDGGTYTTLMVNGAEVAGIASAPAEDNGDGDDDDGDTVEEADGGADAVAMDAGDGPGWHVYFGVASVPRAVAAAVAAGAEVLVEPDAAGDGEPGSMATLRDPQGGVFSVVEVAAG
jgi:uncharacterized protein